MMPVATLTITSGWGPKVTIDAENAIAKLPPGEYGLYAHPLDGTVPVPAEPTPEIIAAAAIAAWPLPSQADLELARKAAPIVLMAMDAAPGATHETVAAAISTMAPAYRAMVKAAQEQPQRKSDAVQAAFQSFCEERGVER